MVGSLKLEYAGKYIGANISMPVIPTWAAASVRFYPLSVRVKDQLSWRPYAYIGGSFIALAAGFVGGGGGADLHLTESRRLCLQPQPASIRTARIFPLWLTEIMYLLTVGKAQPLLAIDSDRSPLKLRRRRFRPHRPLDM